MCYLILLEKNSMILRNILELDIREIFVRVKYFYIAFCLYYFRNIKLFIWKINCYFIW